jgi:hypothetical protein
MLFSATDSPTQLQVHQASGMRHVPLDQSRGTTASVTAQGDTEIYLLSPLVDVALDQRFGNAVSGKRGRNFQNLHEDMPIGQAPFREHDQHSDYVMTVETKRYPQLSGSRKLIGIGDESTKDLRVRTIVMGGKVL